MLVIGILGTEGSPRTHDAGVAIINDGKIIAAAAEERFSRIKHDGSFPFNAISWALKKAGIESFDEVEAIAFPAILPKACAYRTLSYGRSITSSPLYTVPLSYLALRDFIRVKRMAKIIDEGLNKLKIEREKLHFIEHHLAHAASSFYTSGFKKALAITFDEHGEHLTSSINVCDDQGIRRKHHSWVPNSLGTFYSAITRILGFQPTRHEEWKVMGLAAYGDPKICYDKVSRAISLSDDKLHFKFNLSFHMGVKMYFVRNVLRKMGLAQSNPNEPRHVALASYKREDVAAAAQLLSERLVKKLVLKAMENYGIKEVVLAGGVAFNVRINRIIREELGANIFIHPNAGDGGAPLGAAFEAYRQITGKLVNEQMEHTFLGPSFSDESILAELKKHPDLKYDYYDDIAGVVGELLAKDGNLIGWFQGRGEWGPRALGARSCLADPRDIRIKNKINTTIKLRESFLPYTPTILDRAATDYLERCAPRLPTAPFMIDIWMARRNMKKEAPAVVHVDGTARAQILKRDISPETRLYYRLIKSFEENTGLPIILNTSLNLHGKPIVNSPRDAIRECLPHLDYLAMGHYLIRGGNF